MKPAQYYTGLAIVVLLIVAAWLGLLQGLGEWLWNLLHGVSPVK